MPSFRVSLEFTFVLLAILCSVGRESANATDGRRSAVQAKQKGERPNVLIVLVDDMGYGDPGCFNPESKIPTPSIDSLAAEGMTFTDAHAPGPLCHLSRYGLMTGQYPFRADPSAWRRKPTIDEGMTTLPSMLRSVGYSTAMVGKWHLGFQENGYENPLPGGPVDRGFESYFGIRASTDIPPYFFIRDRRAVMPPSEQIVANNSEGWSKIQGAFWREGGISPDLKLPEVLPRFTDEAIEVIQKHATSDAEKLSKSPLMLYLAYPAPHTPWLPSSEFQGKSKVGMYGDFMMMVDAEVGRILASLESAGMKENTLVIFTSDNGPCWYESDDERFQHDSSGGFRGMKADAWEGGHRMPFVCRWPAKVKPRSTSDQLICFTDILSTLAEMTETPLNKNAAPDSFSFYSELTGIPRTTAARTEFVMQTGSRLTLMRQKNDEGDWKLIDGLGSGGFTKPSRIKAKPGHVSQQLYDLKNDPSERTNRLLEADDQTTKRTAELKKRMMQIMNAKSHRQLASDEDGDEAASSSSQKSTDSK